MTYLEALIAARARLISGQNSFICLAIEQVMGYHHSKMYTICIEAMLDNLPTYAHWVQRHHPEIHAIMKVTPNAFREGRIQWLDYLINEEEAKCSLPPRP